MIRRKKLINVFLFFLVLITIIPINFTNAETTESEYGIIGDNSKTKNGYIINDIEYNNIRKSTNTSNSISNNNNNKYDYTINNYNIDMIVNEDNTFDITETITAEFNEPKHGILRKIPILNSVTRLDGTTSNNIAKIKNINVNENYTESYKDNFKIIKIGDADKKITGSHTYIIKYNYNIGKDPLKNEDELYFNLIGDGWDTTINNISFKITMPKPFDKSLLGFSSGTKRFN